MNRLYYKIAIDRHLLYWQNICKCDGKKISQMSNGELSIWYYAIEL